MNSVVESMLAGYRDEAIDERQKLREVMQKVALAGLYRGGFFKESAFYGGTCLRMFYGLPRFSEAMDFSLLEPNSSFSIERYFPAVTDEFKALGLEIEIDRKQKRFDTHIESAFLKNNTEIYDFILGPNKTTKIKIEVDTNPPGGFQTENKVQLLPFSFMVRCYELPYLYAGKIHVLIFRRWKNRVKGRDWFDFEWYVRNSVPMDFAHFNERVCQLEHTVEYLDSIDDFKEIFRERIRTIDFEKAKADVAPFIADTTVLDIWSTDYFLQLVGLMRFQ